MFLTTSTSFYSIPPALLDRMEIIRLPGYLEFEKVEIAKNFLIPKELKANGLETKDIQISDGAIKTVINAYTREAGVRSLERGIAAICRKAARKKATVQKARSFRVVEKQISKDPGAPKDLDSQIEKSARLGVAEGPAWP